MDRRHGRSAEETRRRAARNRFGGAGVELGSEGHRAWDLRQGGGGGLATMRDRSGPGEAIR